jgi:protein involved in polysaccharide export with SLBB domain
MKLMSFPLRKFCSRAQVLCAALLIAGLFTGCETLDSGSGASNQAAPAPPSIAEASSSTVLRVGDSLKIDFSGSGTQEVRPHEETIKDDGTITLSYIGSVKAAGKTMGGLQKEIHDLYVPRYYAYLNVTVSANFRYFYVGGEVKLPNRYPYVDGITVTRAIQSAGDFTDYASKKNVQLIRQNGQKITINVPKAQGDPKLDVPVYPGDTIHVRRSIF